MAAIALVVGLIALVGGLLLAGDDGQTSDLAVAGRVRLEPARGEGPDPFTPSVASPVDLPDRDGSGADPGQPVPDPASEPGESGTAPGVFGGVFEDAACDVDRLIEELIGDEAAVDAWASASGMQPSEVSSHLRTLTPAVLLRDTRATVNGLVEGQAVPRQSVLEAGTVVLVGPSGLPELRCAGGNPLLPPVAFDDLVTFEGDAWSGFDPEDVTSIEEGTPVEVFLLTDVETGEPFARPVGTRGDEDRYIDATTTTTSSTTTTSTSTTTTTAPTTTTTTTSTTTTTTSTVPPSTDTTV